MRPGFRTERAVMSVIAVEKSAEGIVDAMSIEGPNVGRTSRYGDLASAMQRKIQFSGLWSDGKG